MISTSTFLFLVVVLGFSGFVLFRIFNTGTSVSAHSKYTVPPKGVETYQQRRQQPVNNQKTYQSRSYTGGNSVNTTTVVNNHYENRNDDDFLTSMVVAEMTDSPVMGYMAGGSLSGAMVGSMLAEDERREVYVDPTTYRDDSDLEPIIPSPSYSDTSYDSPSSSSSWSSDSSSSDSWSSSSSSDSWSSSSSSDSWSSSSSDSSSSWD